MKFNARKLTEEDYNSLVNWWKWWRWTPIPKNFLPDNGTGGIMIEKENKPIVAGFMYNTNSDAVVVEWIVSNPEYKNKDRKQAVELLLNTIEAVCKQQGKKEIQGDSSYGKQIERTILFSEVRILSKRRIS